MSCQLIIVVFVPFVPTAQACGAAGVVLTQNDDAVGIECSDIAGSAWIAGVGRISIHDLAIGDADKVRAKRPRLALYFFGTERLTENLDQCGTYSSVGCVTARARSACRFLKA